MSMQDKSVIAAKAEQVAMKQQAERLFLDAELTPTEQRVVQRRVASGELNQVHSGIATPLPAADWPALFQREKIRILAALFPKTVVAYRSAFDGMVGSTIYLAGSSQARVVELPGLRVALSSGPGPVEGDTPMQGRELYFPSPARMLLDAVAPAPSDDDPGYDRKVSAEELEQRLISVCHYRGEQAFIDLRERVKAVGAQLNAPRSHLQQLDRLMGAILGAFPDQKMASASGSGRARGYDAARMDLFHTLVQALKMSELQEIAYVASSPFAATNFAFLESYFSNFIEGIEFETEEARAIALEGKISAPWPQDAHDIKSVFDQAKGPWRGRAITDAKAFEEALRERHGLMMAARPEVSPGKFKSSRSAAGNTTFVDPRLVLGTLREAGLLLHDVDAGMPRALLAMFIVSEVHPFNDGNGRLARLVMNSELSAAGEARIIVPTLFRDEYLDCLREMTRAARTKPYLDAMANIRRWTAAFNYDDLDATIDLMKRCNAFENSLVRHQLLWPKNLKEQDDAKT
ncbi:Fic family protein [Variovorax sp. J22G73]|uniref:Fic family protein n=1 Tax=unclassified Variovorax TaxID=663243 RepID=UPI002574DE69|nr:MULTISPECIES: Fic family protein [unclassified Variovorax]MDM0010550.1 Fic family protein [Variovorax sp. J22R203]MDM0102868.1 Fic family protein [Variovorax sp. J22G73]